MISCPMQSKYFARGAPGMIALWTAASRESRKSQCAVPPEFGGPGGGDFPVDFFGMALLNFSIGTCRVIAEKSKVEFEMVTTDGLLIVDRDERGRPSR